MLVREVMHPAGAFVPLGAGLADAAQAIMQSGFDCVPVLESERVVGMITGGALVAGFLGSHPEVADDRVDGVMTRDGVCCQEDLDVEIALRQMDARQVTRMVVVDRQGHALGVVARDDVSSRPLEAQTPQSFIEAYLEYHDPTGR